jgi:nucleotide-binding universal stress UspA family protein
MSSSKQNRVVRIVAAVEPSAASEHVLTLATSFDASLPEHELHLIHVVEVPAVVEGPYVAPVADFLHEGKNFVDGLVKATQPRTNGKVIGHVAVGQPREQILQLASDVEADFVIVGTHGRRTIGTLLLGSVSQSVVKHARCAVIVARPKNYVASPEIEPACPRCLEMQQQTNGETMWCEEHGKHHPHAKLHYETPPTFAVGSMLIRPS